jgi:ADP-heptose:LPS heptosyltransferase
LILGGPDEEALKRATADAMRRAYVLVEPVSLRRTAALLRLSRLALCNDSGLMHIASCAGAPTVGIFGPTDERRNAPMGKPSLVVRSPLPGFPLWTSKNVGNRASPSGVDPAAALEALSVEEAWEQVAPWLEETLGEHGDA